MSLFPGLGTDVCFTGEEAGTQWEDSSSNFRPRWSGKPSCHVEQTRAHRGIRWQSSSARVSLSSRDLADQGWACITQGAEPQQRERAAGVKALCSMLAATTSGRAKEIVKQCVADKNGMIQFGRIKTAGVAKLTDDLQFQWNSNENLDDKWMKWVKLMRQLGTTSLGDDARETLSFVGLERAKEQNLEQHLRLRAPETWVVSCACADQYLRTTVDSISTQPTPMDINAVVSTCACCGKSGHETSTTPKTRLSSSH